MTKIFLLTALLLCAPGIRAQTISGVCTDPAGNPAEYVAIGVSGTRVATFSDRQGRFSLHIPDSLRGEVLLFSHLSYEKSLCPIDSLAREGEVRIRLQPAVFQLEAAVARATTTKTVTLHARGTRLPGLRVHYDFNNHFGHNIGQLIALPGKSVIRQVAFSIDNSFEKLVVAVELYRLNVSEGTGKVELVPLIRSPRYVEVGNGGKMEEYTIDFKEDAIETDGPVYVRLELVEKSGPGEVAFSAWGRATKIFVDKHTGQVMSFPIGIGIRLRGAEVKD